MNKPYTIVQSFENGDRHEKGESMTKAQAIKLAKSLAAKFQDDRNIFITCAGNGGYGCYLNPDGNHDISGKKW